MLTLSKSLLLLALCILCAGGYAACSLTRAGYQSPAYKLLSRSGKLEIREYPDLLLAQTPSSFEKKGGDGSFMRLFRFLSRGNSAEQKLPMTTPVLFRRDQGQETMAFVLPAEMSPASAPNPRDPAVRLTQRAAGTFATIRSGGTSAAARERALFELRGLLENSAWEPCGEAEFASYDPPWIPSVFQRNEVFLNVRTKSSLK